MSTKNFLDKTGTLYFLVKIKSFLSSNYVAKDGDKVLSTNDYTNADKTKLAGIETGATNTPIDDTTTSASSVWSSSKVNTELSGKQGNLTAGNNIDITNNVISATGLLEIDDTTTSNSKVWSSNKTNTLLSGKQDELTAGDRISISGNTISATSEINDATSSETSTYSSDKIDDLLGDKQDTLTAGTNIDITGNVISVDGVPGIDDSTTSSTTLWSSSKINTELGGKQDTLTAGTRISITSENVINAETEIDDTSSTTTSTWSASKIIAALAALNTLTFAIVQSLPTTDISTKTIYLVPKSPAQTNNSYDEYIYINNAWEKIGDTTIDLSGYVKDTDLVPITNEEIDAMFAS